MVIVNQGEQRSVTIPQLVDLHRQGIVTEGSYAWREGMAEWLPISSIPELKAALPKAEPSEVSALLEAPSGAMEMDDSLPTTMLQSPVEPPRAPAPPAPAPGPFPAPAPPAPRPAAGGAPPPSSAARRPGPERPDLLASAQASDVGLAQSAGKIPQTAIPTQPLMQNRGGQLVIPGQKESSMMNLPTAFFMAQLNSPGRKKRLFGVAGVSAAITVAVGIFAIRALDSKEKDSVAQGWSALHTCLIGDALKERETVSDRIRNIQLALIGTPVERRGKPGQPAWPQRCAAAADDLSKHAKNAGGEVAPLQASAEALAKALLADGTVTASINEQAEKVWADAGKAKLQAGAAAAGAIAAPKPATAMSFDAFSALPKFLSGGFSVQNVRPAAAGNQATFVIDQQDFADGPHVCSLAGAAARCSKVPAAAAKLSPGLRLAGNVDDGARPFLFAGDHGQSGILKPDTGEVASSAYVLGAHSRKDGALWALLRGGARDARLLFVPASGAKGERPSARDLGGDAVSSATLAAGWLAYRTGPKAAPASKLVFRKLGDKNEEPAAAVEAGDIDEALPSEADAAPIRRPGKQPPPSGPSDDERAAVACRFDETLAVRFRTPKGDAVSVFQAGKWSPPLKSPSSGGLFTCRKGEATSVKVTPVMEQDKNWASISHVRCNISGCNATNVSMKDLLPNLVEAAAIDDKSVLAADIDGKLLVVWNAGYVGGVRMRMAPPGQIKDADDVVLVDARDPKNPMKLSVITELKLLPSGSSALLMLGGPSGARALRIDGAGAVSPVQVTVQ